MSGKEDPLHRLSRTPTKAYTNQTWEVWKEAEKERTRPLKEWGKSPTRPSSVATTPLPSCATASPARKPTTAPPTQTPTHKEKSSATPRKNSSKPTPKKTAPNASPTTKTAKTSNTNGAASSPKSKKESPAPVKASMEKNTASVSKPVGPSVVEKEISVKPVSKQIDDDNKVTVIPAKIPPPPATAPEPATLRKIQAPDKQEAMKLFDSLDENASGKLSLAELDKGVVEMFPEWDNKPAIMAAYNAADISGNGYVERKEFGYFLQYMVYYNNIWSVFDAMDEDADRRISRDEFHAAATKLEVDESVFDDIDVNGGGMILFGELVDYLATNKSTWNDEDMAEIRNKLEDESPADNVVTSTDKDIAPPPPPPEPVPNAVMQIEIPSKEEGMRLFDQLDENASGKLSLAELDKGVVTLFPEWNNKPAIMAAYKACDQSNNGFVERKEFGYFLRYLVYYNNLWSLFASMDEDHDRRISKEEFVAAADKMSLPRDATEVFDEIDANGGGMILFDELIHWMAIMGSDAD